MDITELKCPSEEKDIHLHPEERAACSTPSVSRSTSEPELSPAESALCMGSDMGGQHVVLRFEAMRDSYAKALMWWARLGSLSALITCIILVSLKVRQHFYVYNANQRTTQTANLVVGGICMASLLPTFVQMVWHWRTVSAAEGIWSPRRWRIFLIAFCILVVQVLSCTAYIIANARALAPCTLIRDYKTTVAMFAVQSSLLNTAVILYLIQAGDRKPVNATSIHWIGNFVSRMKCLVWKLLQRKTLSKDGGSNAKMNQPGPQFVVDCSMWYHLPKLLLWVFVEAMILTAAGLLVHNATTAHNRGNSYIKSECALLRSLEPFYSSPGDYICPNSDSQESSEEDIYGEQCNVTVGYIRDEILKIPAQNQSLAGREWYEPYDNFCNANPNYVQLACEPQFPYEFSAMRVELWYVPFLLECEMNLTRASQSPGCALTYEDLLGLEAGGWRDLALQRDMRWEEYWQTLTTVDQDRLASFDDVTKYTREEREQNIAYTLRSNLLVHSSYAGSKASPALIAQVTMLAFAWVLYIVNMMLAFKIMNRLPYVAFRSENVLLRWEFRSVFNLFFVINMSWLLLWFVDYKDKFNSAWAGNLGVWMPLQIGGTFLAIELAILYCPKLHSQLADPMQEHLQQIVWHDNTHQRKLGRSMALDPKGGGQSLNRDTLFCFETALKAFYWSFLAYECHKEPCPVEAIPLGLDMSGYKVFRKIRHDGLDGAVVVAWGPNGIVISFRGTESIKNAITDVKVWPNKVGQLLDHIKFPILKKEGFWDSWQALKTEVLAAVKEAMHQKDPSTNKFKILLTGHSLGGALSVVGGPQIWQALCDECESLGRSASSLEFCCYTFGSPRVGNFKFAQLYDQCIPETWHIINDQDMVPRLDPFTKFLFPYKRTGHQVIINKRGDMIVRPSFAEKALWTLPLMTQRSVAHHFLTGGGSSYGASLWAVVETQRRGEGFENGKLAVEAVLQHNHALKEMFDTLMTPVTPQVKQPVQDEEADDGIVERSMFGCCSAV